jgi:hypothetical protein
MTDDERAGAARDEQAQEHAAREQFKQLHGFDLALEMAVSLVSFGSQKLGLNAATADLRDLEDARLSIELLRALLGVLEGEGGQAPAAKAPIGELRETLAQLQLGYVHALRLEEAAASGEAPAEGPAPAHEAAAEAAPAQPAAAEAPEEPQADEAPEEPRADDAPEEPRADEAGPERERP